MLDLAKVDFSQVDNFKESGFYVTTSYYQRFKVFSDKGVRRANFKQTVWTKNKEEIKNIKALTYNLINGEIKKTEFNLDDVHTTKLNEYQNQVSFSVPNVKEGSVFEIRYDRKQKVSYSLPSWYFTSDVPSVKSSITIDFLDALEYYADKHIVSGQLDEKFAIYQSDLQIGNSKLLTGTARTYTLYNIPSFQNEPYTNSRRNYTNWIGFQLKSMKNQQNITINVVHDFSSYCQQFLSSQIFKENMSGSGIPKKEWSSLIHDGMSISEKTQAIYEFVRSSMKWSGVGGVMPIESNSKIWKDKTGSMAEINLLLVNTLRQAGISAFPMLVSNRGKGYVNRSYPIMEDYVGLDIYVPIAKDSDLVLDASSKYIPFGVPSADLLNTYGLVLIGGSDGYYWYQIIDRIGTREFVTINGDMDDNGHLTGEMTLYANTYNASSLIAMKTANVEAGISEYLKSRLPNVTIESVKDSMNKDEFTFFYVVKFSEQISTDNDGNVYLSIPAVYGSSTNVFVNRERTSDVDFGYRSRSDVVMQIKIPDDYIFDTILPSMALSMQDKSITFMFDAEVEDGIVTMRQRIDYARSLFPTETYNAFYEFFQKYYTLKQKPVVLKKKS